MNIPEKVVKRLTLYHCIFTDYAEKNIEFITSPQIANLLNIDESLVRKDLKKITVSKQSIIILIAFYALTILALCL